MGPGSAVFTHTNKDYSASSCEGFSPEGYMLGDSFYIWQPFWQQRILGGLFFLFLDVPGHSGDLFFGTPAPQYDVDLWPIASKTVPFLQLPSNFCLLPLFISSVWKAAKRNSRKPSIKFFFHLSVQIQNTT